MPKLTIAQAKELAKNVKLIVMDVDGVLTDGKIILSADGSETKNFDVKDGYGMAMAMYRGIKIAWISGRYSRVTDLRATELGIDHVIQNCRDKHKALTGLCGEMNINPENVMFIGDDTIDLPAMKLATISIAVADAHPAVINTADWVTANKGGNGAVREAIDLVLG